MELYIINERHTYDTEKLHVKERNISYMWKCKKCLDVIFSGNVEFKMWNIKLIKGRIICYNNGDYQKKKRYNFHPPSCMKHHSTKIKTKKRLGMNKESWKEKIKSIP